MKILSVGEMVIDFLPGAEKNSYICKAGGAPANAAIALARQGCQVKFCGMLGDDDFGHFLRDTLTENGVEHCVSELTSEAVTTMTFVSLTESGERSFTFVRKPGADMLLKKEHVRGENLDEAVLVHAGSCSLSAGTAADATAYALAEGHRRGKLVSFDVNYRNLMWNDDSQKATDAVRKILGYVDFLKISDEEVVLFGGEEKLPELMKEYGITLLVETLGAKGARCFWNDKILTQSGLKAECVDTCGAGDAFWGSFLATILKNGVTSKDQLNEEVLIEAMKMGNIAGWLCVQKKGAIESLPGTAEVEWYRKELY